MKISVTNNLTINAPKTYTTVLANAGTSVFNVKNLIGFNTSYALQLGETGEAQSEVLLFSASQPTGTLGTTTANSVFDHAVDTPIYQIKYDQIVFEASTTGTAGTATPITNGTVNIQPNSPQTTFDHTAGAVTYAYKTMFRNSVLAVNSSESDWIVSGGFSYYSLGKMRQRVKDKLVSSSYLSGVQGDDTMINDWLNEYQEMMSNRAADVNEDYQLGTMTIAFSGTTELGTITATDFKGGFRRVWYADGSGTFQAQKMDSNSFSPNKTFVNTFPYFYMQGDNVIGRKPFDNAGTFICEYPKLTSVMVEDTDTPPITMWGYSKGFIDYAHAQALFKDQKVEEAEIKENRALQYIERFAKDITPRNKTGATYIDTVEDMGSDQEIWL